jgi:hypothetical protein
MVFCLVSGKRSGVAQCGNDCADMGRSRAPLEIAVSMTDEAILHGDPLQVVSRVKP